ncbi:hypothetical protein, partial [Endozoicomonas sp. YOMI1]|uniref:hypothetical protein n=1 Tax=Endozoicomonas sp. YOMI1 TaxID=2828739 RepID=UPI002148B745
AAGGGKRAALTEMSKLLNDSSYGDRLSRISIQRESVSDIFIYKNNIFIEFIILFSLIVFHLEHNNNFALGRNACRINVFMQERII